MYENLKLHREVVDQVKYQLWPLDKKLRMIRQAKNMSKLDATPISKLTVRVSTRNLRRFSVGQVEESFL